MKISTKEQQRAEFLLQSQRIQLHQIESFSFMERYPRQAHKDIPTGKAKYGPGIFVFHLKEKQDKVIYMPPFRHPSSLVRFLVSQGVPFANYVPRDGAWKPSRRKLTGVPRCICFGSSYYSLCS